MHSVCKPPELSHFPLELFHLLCAIGLVAVITDIRDDGLGDRLGCWVAVTHACGFQVFSDLLLVVEPQNSLLVDRNANRLEIHGF